MEISLSISWDCCRGAFGKTPLQNEGFLEDTLLGSRVPLQGYSIELRGPPWVFGKRKEERGGGVVAVGDGVGGCGLHVYLSQC